MADTFRLTLAQLNPTVGAIEANADRVRTAWDEARRAGADMLAMPEMFITGYQPQDLVLKPAFTAHAMRAIETLAADCADGPAIGVGAPHAADGRLHNAYFVLEGGRIAARMHKVELPNYNVFDEKRLYDAGPIAGPYRVGPLRIGTPICEDAWFAEVSETLAETGAEILLVPNGSPYYRGKFESRVAHMVARTVETGLPLVYLNMVGGQDDQVFDGGSFVLNPHGASRGAEAALRRVPDPCRFRPAPTRAGAPSMAHARASPTPGSRTTASWSRGCATTWRKAASARSCSGSPAASTARWWPPSPPMRSAPRTCAA
jgi:NAD+ synthase